MKFVLGLSQFLSVFSLITSAGISNAATGEDTLVLLHVLFRHGNRTPDKSSQFPTDPYINATFAPFGYSQLTTKGKETEYKIGQYLRQTYGQFIPQQYTPNVVQGLSTNFKRTKMSLELVQSALFPPLLTDVFLPGLNWQPIPFNIEQAGGLIGVPSIYCPNYITQYYNYVISDAAQEIIASFKDLYLELSGVVGYRVKTPDDVTNIFCTLESEIDFGLELPAWTSSVFPTTLENAAAVSFQFATANSQLRKFSAGYLLQKIIQDSISLRDGTASQGTKVFLYSAHDYNVATILNTLDVYHLHYPPYGATVFFEIHNIGGVYGLKLYYQDYTQTNPQLLTIPGCSSFCDLDTLSEIVQPNLPGPADVCTYTFELE